MEGRDADEALVLQGLISGIQGLIFSTSLMFLLSSLIVGHKDTKIRVLVFWMAGVCIKGSQVFTDWTQEGSVDLLLNAFAIETVAYGIGSMPPLAAVAFVPDWLSTVSMAAAVVLLCLSAVLGKVYAALGYFVFVALYRLSILVTIIVIGKFIISPKLAEVF